jgi:creatinine amidohydrolase
MLCLILTQSCSPDQPVSQSGPGSGTAGEIFQLKELNTRQIQALDKERTVVLMPGGILEEHGPYLPAFTDGYWNEKLTDTIARVLSSDARWQVVIFPTIPLGNSGANDVGEKYSFPGTYTVRFETLRSIFMDLAVELGEQGFRHIFIIHSHGAPNHQRALDQAADFFNDTYAGKMINLMGIAPLQFSWFDGPDAQQYLTEEGMKMHAGMAETSSMLYIVPHLVDSGYRNAPSQAGPDMETLVDIARNPQWPGYFGSLPLASARYGREAWQMNAASCLHYVSGILNQTINPDTIPRFADLMAESAIDVELDTRSRQEEQRRKALQTQWLTRKGLD